MIITETGNMIVKNEIEQTGGGFWDTVKLMFIALAIAMAVAGLVLVIFYFLAYNFLEKICKNSWIYGLIAVLGMVLEIGGLIGSIFAGAGIPFVALGMFLEIFTILCDFMRKDPGWQLDVGLGIFGLLPVVGLLGSFGKYGRKLFKLIS